MVSHSFTILFCFDKLDVCSRFLHQNAYSEKKFASQLSCGGAVNSRIERTTWRKEREENGRGQNGGVTEKAERGREGEREGEREQMIAWNERGIEGREEEGRSERQR